MYFLSQAPVYGLTNLQFVSRHQDSTKLDEPIVVCGLGCGNLANRSLGVPAKTFATIIVSRQRPRLRPQRRNNGLRASAAATDCYESTGSSLEQLLHSSRTRDIHQWT